MTSKGVHVSRDLNWLLVRNFNCNLKKVRGINRQLSRSSLNPKGLHVPRFEGNIQRKALTVQPNPSGKGVVLIYKKKDQRTKPSKNVAKIELNKDSRRSLRNIRKFVNKNLYRCDLKNIALRRASALLRSQRPKPIRKIRGKAAQKKTE